MSAKSLPIRLITAGLLLTLAACGRSPEPPSDTPTQTMIPVEPDGGIGDGAGPPPDEASAAISAQIPTRFRGVWDYIQGTCARESDMRAEISGDEIMFYESIGKVIAVSGAGDDLVVTLAMEGEGETWQQQTRLSLVEDAGEQRLKMGDGALPKAPSDYPKKRCP